MQKAAFSALKTDENFGDIVNQGPSPLRFALLRGQTVVIKRDDSSTQMVLGNQFLEIACISLMQDSVFSFPTQLTNILISSAFGYHRCNESDMK